MDIDLDKLISALSEGIATSLQKLTKGIDRKVTDLTPPGMQAAVDEKTGIQTTPDRLPLSASEPQSIEPPKPIDAVTSSVVMPPAFSDTFTTIDLPKPPEPVKPPLRQPQPVASAGEHPFAQAEVPPARPLVLPQEPIRPFAESATPFSRVDPPLQLPRYSQVDMRRGFMADDPGAVGDLRHEQTATVQRFDQTTDMLFDSMLKQQELDRNFRQRQYDLSQQMLRDMNADYRRIDELERAHECSRENVTDVNL